MDDCLSVIDLDTALAQDERATPTGHYRVSLRSIDDDELHRFTRTLVTPAPSVRLDDPRPYPSLGQLPRRQAPLDNDLASQTSDSSRSTQSKSGNSRSESVMLFNKIRNGDDDLPSFDFASSDLHDFIDPKMFEDAMSRPASRAPFMLAPLRPTGPETRNRNISPSDDRNANMHRTPITDHRLSLQQQPIKITESFKRSSRHFPLEPSSSSFETKKETLRQATAQADNHPNSKMDATREQSREKARQLFRAVEHSVYSELTQDAPHVVNRNDKAHKLITPRQRPLNTSRHLVDREKRHSVDVDTMLALQRDNDRRIQVAKPRVNEVIPSQRARYPADNLDERKLQKERTSRIVQQTNERRRWSTINTTKELASLPPRSSNKGILLPISGSHHNRSQHVPESQPTLSIRGYRSRDRTKSMPESQKQNLQYNPRLPSTERQSLLTVTGVRSRDRTKSMPENRKPSLELRENLSNRREVTTKLQPSLDGVILEKKHQVYLRRPGEESRNAVRRQSRLLENLHISSKLEANASPKACLKPRPSSSTGTSSSTASSDDYKAHSPMFQEMEGELSPATSGEPSPFNSPSKAISAVDTSHPARISRYTVDKPVDAPKNRYISINDVAIPSVRIDPAIMNTTKRTSIYQQSPPVTGKDRGYSISTSSRWHQSIREPSSRPRPRTMYEFSKTEFRDHEDERTLSSAVDHPPSAYQTGRREIPSKKISHRKSIQTERSTYSETKSVTASAREVLASIRLRRQSAAFANTS
ncbi:hypothetical protein EC973_002680 [Apophysomyces ossiformis]|uniref:Uncharacterized protein n=1 Tax=Apophysomyces ossiformis TaxID=679940 RepID=A0A8H7BMK8_9FUNG|nr:hypothetical protein EC973_002680 [Apophysomyces ossiformis]